MTIRYVREFKGFAGILQVALLEWKAARPVKERAAGTVFVPH